MKSFHYNSCSSFEDFAGLLRSSSMELPLEKDMKSLGQPISIHGKTIPNRLCIQPTEGFDSREDGSLSELVHRRYRRQDTGHPYDRGQNPGTSWG